MPQLKKTFADVKAIFRRMGVICECVQHIHSNYILRVFKF